MPLRLSGLVLAALLLAMPERATAQCRASAAGTYSFDMRVSVRAGVLCIHTVDVYAGASCDGAPEWSVDLGCNQTSRLAISDRARLISVLAPRASHRDWAIVTVTSREGGSVALRLGELPGIEALRGTARVELDGDAVRLRGGTDVRVSFQALEAQALRSSAEAAPQSGMASSASR
ncbi:MAG: hypothetical protein M3Y87_27275 [Myxococcota bacterium]|nr:hypothetical protein [Myxococcota bacterium]